MAIPDFYESTADVAMERLQRQGAFSMPSRHFHPWLEIYYLLEGELTYLIEDRVYPVKKGSVVFINENRIHRTASLSGEGHERILIRLETHVVTEIGTLFPSADFSALFSGHGFVWDLKEKEQDEMERFLARVMREMEQKAPGYEEVVKLSMMELLFLFRRKTIEASVPSQPLKSEKYRRVYAIVRYMTENYRDIHTLQDLCRVFYLDKFYLCHVFKEVTGLTVKEYLNAVRVKRAAELLISGGRSITAVSQDVGYESVTHFGRVFRKLMGTSPTQYRKKHRKP